MRTFPRFRAFKADHLPTRASNKAYVYDYRSGAVARDASRGRLAYFPTLAEAKRWAKEQNEKEAV